MFGECTAGGAYIPALSDEVVMTAGNSSVHLGGPQIVKAAIKRDRRSRTRSAAPRCTAPYPACRDHFARDEMRGDRPSTRDIVGALNRVQQRLWRRRSRSGAPLYDAADIPGIVGADLTRPFDQREIIARLVDGSEFHEFKPLYGPTLVCGFAHIQGLPVGILANNGVLFSESALKGAHFIELCDQRNVPLLFLQNITGFMVGSTPSATASPRTRAKLVYAVANARVPRYTLVTGGSYGAGNYGMSGRGFRPRFMFMWPNARLGTMSPDVGSSGADGSAPLQHLAQSGRREEELAEHEAKAAAACSKSSPILTTARRGCGTTA